MAYVLPPTPAEAKGSDRIPAKEIVRYRAELVKIMTDNYSRREMIDEGIIRKILRDANALTDAVYGKSNEKL